MADSGGTGEVDMTTALRQRHQHHWTEAECDIVRRDYKGTNADADRIAARLESYVKLSQLRGEK